MWVLVQQTLNLGKVLSKSLQRLLQICQQVCRIVHGHGSLGTSWSKLCSQSMPETSFILCTPSSLACWSLSAPAHSCCASLMQLPLQRIQSAITPALAAALSHQGWAVADQVLGRNAALNILDEMRGLQDSMHLNSTHLVKAHGRELLEKTHIHEAELFDQASGCNLLFKHLWPPCLLQH